MGKYLGTVLGLAAMLLLGVVLVLPCTGCGGEEAAPEDVIEETTDTVEETVDDAAGAVDDAVDAAEEAAE